MATKGEVRDSNSISEKKMSRIKALEKRLSSPASAYLPSASQSQNQVKKKKIHAGTMESSNPKAKLPLASSASPGCSNLQDSKANDPAYFQLRQPVHENLLESSLQISRGRVGGGAIHGVVHDLLKSGNNTDKYIEGALTKILQDQFILLDNATLPGSASARARVRALRSLGKRSKKHMSMRQHRQCGSFDFPRKYQNYNLYAPMHEMWKEHIRHLLRNCRQKHIESCLLTADFHGAIFVVVESRNKSFTGVQGIMIRETVNTFGIITSENRFQVVPKKGSIFMFQVDLWRVTLRGDNLSSRNINQDQSTRC
eukprot:Gb_07057 [translate_table: standard]